jgi:hypothetical protein
MAKSAKGIIDLSISVTLRDTPVFNIQAGGDPAAPGLLPLVANGFGNVNAPLLREILGKLIASYPNKPINLCVEGMVIVPDDQCGPGTATAAASAATSMAISAATPEAAVPKTKSPRKTTKRKKS